MKPEEDQENPSELTRLLSLQSCVAECERSAMSANYCNCPNCQTVDCPNGEPSETDIQPDKMTMKAAPFGSVDDLVNGLRHIADDHECCRQTIELVIERLEHQDLYLRSAGCADTLEDARRRADKGIRSPNDQAER